MTDLEKRAHDLAVAYLTESRKNDEPKFKFKINDSDTFMFGLAYCHVYKGILKALEEQKASLND